MPIQRWRESDGDEMKFKNKYMPSVPRVVFGLVLLIILVLLEIDIRTIEMH